MKQEQTYPIVKQDLITIRKSILTSKGFKKWNNHIKTELKKYHE